MPRQGLRASPLRSRGSGTRRKLSGEEISCRLSGEEISCRLDGERAVS
jgi:hypothetical protein